MAGGALPLQRITRFALVLCFLSFLVCPLSLGQDQANPELWIKQAEAVLASTESYTAIFHKLEWVKGRYKERETIYLKFKKPFKVYMKWIGEPGKGREILYVDGWNDNRIRVRECGVRGLITLNLNPHGQLAMGGSRHPITDAGLGHLLKLFGDNLQRGLRSGQLEYRIDKEGTVYGRTTQPTELIFPRDPRNGYYCYRSIISLDVEKRLPIRVQIFDWEDSLIEDYGYEELTLNAGLTDADFDPRNPNYKF
jgi:outer membrane lipoprotein-sorting protein